jgi:hypothetical protein
MWIAKRRNCQNISRRITVKQKEMNSIKIQRQEYTNKQIKKPLLRHHIYDQIVGILLNIYRIFRQITRT